MFANSECRYCTSYSPSSIIERLSMTFTANEKTGNGSFLLIIPLRSCLVSGANSTEMN